jgi:hypothetical protein
MQTVKNMNGKYDLIDLFKFLASISVVSIHANVGWMRFPSRTRAPTSIR